MAAVRSSLQGPGAFGRDDHVESHYNPFNFRESDQISQVGSFDFVDMQQKRRKQDFMLIGDAEYPLHMSGDLPDAHIYTPVSPFDVATQYHFHDPQAEPFSHDTQGDEASFEIQRINHHTSADLWGSNNPLSAASSPDMSIPTASNSSPNAGAEAEIEIDDNIDVDWTEFSPPSLLGKTQGIESRILRRIVASSIESVKAKAEEERQRKRHNEESMATVDELIGEGRSDQLLLPIRFHEHANDAPEPGPGPEVEIEGAASASARADVSIGPNEPTQDAGRSSKRKTALKRLFRRGADKDEGEPVTGTRETLREKLRVKLKSLDIDASALSVLGAAGALFDGSETLT
jgi:hypothetical protein